MEHIVLILQKFQKGFVAKVNTRQVLAETTGFHGLTANHNKRIGLYSS